MKEKFRVYLILQGYKTVTPSGKPSTVSDYLSRVEKVCKIENMTYETLARNIGRIVSEYDIGGPKEFLGKTSHNSVINALRRFQEFCQSQYVG